MFKQLAIGSVLALGLGAFPALAAEEGGHGGQHIEDFAFSFEGPFGTYDQHQLQRGLQIFTEVCAACHGLKYVPIRSLADEGGVGLPEDQVRAYAAAISIDDPETGETRDGKPTDHFPENTGAGAPDLSLMAKARAGFHGPGGLGINQLVKGMGGPEYIASLLTGYTGHEKEEAGSTLYENHAFSTGYISMPPPLSDGLVEFRDGHPNDVEHMAEDVAAFLMWAAEPKLTARKETGFLAIAFMVLLTSLLYLTNKKLWAGPKRKA